MSGPSGLETMKILFDEDVPRPLADYFPDGIQVSTAQQMGWGGKENGELLQLAARSSFTALVTLDRNMEHQQDLRTLPLAIIVLRARQQGLADFANLVTSHVVGLLEKGVEKRVYRFDGFPATR